MKNIRTYLHGMFALVVLLPSFVSAALPAPGGDDAGLTLWLKANEGITGNPVTQWNDQSGLGNHVVHMPGVTGGTETGPTYYDVTTTQAINFQPVTGYANNQHLQNLNNNLGITNEHDIFVVKRGGTQTATNALYFSVRPQLQTGFDGIALGVVSVDYERYLLQNNIDNNVTIQGGVAQAIPKLINAHSNGAVMSLLENGLLLDVDNTLTTPILDGVPGNDVWVGSFPFGNGTYGQHFGDVAEVIVYTASKAPALRTRIQSYLAMKYSIMMSGGTTNYIASDGTTIAWNATTAGIYINNLATIGRDDNSSLAQITSKSLNTDAVVTITAEGEGSNVASSFADMGDKEFFTIANDGGTNAWTTTGAPDSYKILTRTWNVQEVGDVGAVQLDVDVANATFNLPLLEQGTVYRFLYDSNSDGSLADETALDMINTTQDTWVVTGVNLADGQKFTFADTADTAPIYRFWSPRYTSHFYTKSLEERDHVIADYTDDIWMYEGVAMNAFPSAGPGHTAIYRFWSPIFKSHFYTMNDAERVATSLDDNWNFEKVEWFAYPSDGLNRTAVYRFWSENYRAHFYTTSLFERNDVANNNPLWSYEGIAYWVPTN